jgi:hypothetical protein
MKKLREIAVTFASDSDEGAYWEREGSTADLGWRRAKRVRRPIFSRADYALAE